MRAFRRPINVFRCNRAHFHWVRPLRENGQGLAVAPSEQTQPQSRENGTLKEQHESTSEERAAAVRNLNIAAQELLAQDATDKLPLSYSLKVNAINPKRLRDISEALRRENVNDSGSEKVEVIHTNDWKALFQALSDNVQIVFEAQQTIGETENTPNLRRTLLEGHDGEEGPRYVNCHVEEILFPTVWTKDSFLLLVHDLTSSTMNQLESRITYSTKVGHSHAVTGRLIWLVKQAHVQEHITTEALDLVFRHLSRNATSSMISGVLTHFEESAPSLLTPKHYHVAFQRAITEGGYYNGYRGCLSVIKRMNKRSIKAESMTLVTVLQLASSPQERAAILQHLDNLGMTHDVDLQTQILGYMAADSVIPAIQRGTVLTDVLYDINSKHGSSWLTRRGAERLMSRLRDEGLLNEAEVMPKLLERYTGQLPSVGELQVLLIAAKRLNDMQRAIKYFKRFTHFYGITEPTTRILEILFKLAYDCRLYNCTRFLYQYGCLTGMLTFIMRDRITTSLAYIKDPFLEESDHQWRKSVGRACLSVCLNADYHVAFSVGNWTNTRSICKEDSMRGPGSTSHALASRIYAEDTELFKRFEFRGGFADTLEKAFETDKEWQKQGVDITWPLFKKVQNMSKVPLVVRGSKRPEQGREGWVLGKNREW